MSEETIQLDLPLLLPDIADDRDQCIGRLERLLENRRGIVRVHVNHDNDPAQL